MENLSPVRRWCKTTPGRVDEDTIANQTRFKTVKVESVVIEKEMVS